MHWQVARQLQLQIHCLRLNPYTMCLHIHLPVFMCLHMSISIFPNTQSISGRIYTDLECDKCGVHSPNVHRHYHSAHGGHRHNQCRACSDSHQITLLNMECTSMHVSLSTVQYCQHSSLCNCRVWHVVLYGEVIDPF